jgi:hypothetical protein
MKKREMIAENIKIVMQVYLSSGFEYLIIKKPNNMVKGSIIFNTRLMAYDLFSVGNRI